MKIFTYIFWSLLLTSVHNLSDEEERREQIRQNIENLKFVEQDQYYDIPNPFKYFTKTAYTVGELSEKHLIELQIDEDLKIQNTSEESAVQYIFLSKEKEKQKEDIEKQIQKTEDAQEKIAEFQSQLQEAEETQKSAIEQNIKNLQLKFGLNPADTIKKLQQRIDNQSPLHFIYEFDNSEKGDHNQQYTKLPDEKLQFKLYEKSENISKINFYQNELRKYMKTYGLINGPLLDENEIKYEEDGKEYNLQIQGNFIPLTEALNPILNSAQTDKHIVLQNIMIMSVVFKKVLVMMKTLSGIQNFQCPDANNKEKISQLNEFIQKVDQFDYFSKQLIQKESDEFKKNNIENIRQIKEDLNQGIQTEHYNPAYELKNITDNKNQNKDLKNHYTYYNPLGHLKNFAIDFGHVPEDKCYPEIFKNNPILVPFLNSDMLGFSDEPFELVYYYDKVIKKVVTDDVTGQLKLGEIEFEDYSYDDIENSKEFMEQVIKLANKDNTIEGNIFKSLILKSKDILKNVDKMIQRIKWERENSKKEQMPKYNQDVNDDSFYDQLEKIIVMVKIQQREIPKVYSDKLTIKEIVYYLSDPQILLQDIIDKYIKQRQQYYSELIENLPTEEQRNVKITKEYDVQKIKALYKFNINRMMAFLYQNLKFSPFVHPESFLLLKNIGYEDQIQETYDYIFNQIKDVETEEEQINKIEQIIRNDEILKEHDPSEILNTAQIVEKLTNNKNYKYNSKVHLTLKSFADFIHVFIKEQVSSDASIKQCFTPLHLMNRGSECPIFIKDLKRFIGSHNEIKINFESIYGLYLYYFDTDPDELIQSMDSFIEYMFVFARLERQKFTTANDYLNLDKLINQRIVELYNFSHQRIIFENDSQKQNFENFIFAATLEDMGELYPEYKNISEDFLISQIDPNIPISHDKGSNDKDFIVVQEREQKLEKLYTSLEQLKNNLNNKLNLRII